MPVANTMLAAPSRLPQALAEIVVAVARGAAKDVPPALAGIEPSDEAKSIAASLLAGERKAILLGNAVAVTCACALLALSLTTLALNVAKILSHLVRPRIEPLNLRPALGGNL